MVKNLNIRPIGIAGVARSGKDTLFKLINKYCELPTVRVSLADALKEEVRPIVEKFGIDPFTDITAEKEMIRPLLIAYAHILRTRTYGTYFTNIIQKQINKAIANNVVPIITDIRFAEYQLDELYWLKNTNKGNLIYLERLSENGVALPPPNPTEAANDPTLRNAADLTIQWPTVNVDFKKLSDHAQKAAIFVSNACKND